MDVIREAAMQNRLLPSYTSQRLNLLSEAVPGDLPLPGHSA